ncbi:MAG: metal ABC transporter substrate-binding protein [Lachnospiraceae bacterium]|nr:metal ABC transporter substrate-binding protein [Lachnospiraceae bacterium]
MKNKYLFVTILLVAMLLAGMGFTKVYTYYEGTPADQEISIVTSFYPMYIATLNIVGDTEGVKLSNLSEPQTGCLHDYQLTPADMKLLSTADVFVVNGGGIESFLSDVADSYENLDIINACDGLELLDDNAHAWMNISDYSKQVEHICDALCEIDPIHAETYETNAHTYLHKLEHLMEEAQELKESAEGEKIIIFHEAYDYVAKEYGMEVVYSMDLDEERQISAGEVAELVDEINSHNIRIVLAEELYGKSMGDTVEKETDATVYYLDSLTRGDYEADSYLNGMEENIHILKEALNP